MRNLTINELTRVSAGNFNVLDSAKLGAQIGAPVGTLVGGGLGLLVGADMAGACGGMLSILWLPTLPVVGAVSGFYTGAIGLGAAFGGSALIYNTVCTTTKAFASFIYN